MEITPQKRIGRLLDDFVTRGEDDSPQRMGRMGLNVLLQAMCAKNPKHSDTPTSVKECVDRVQASAEKDYPGFVFAYDSRLLDADLGVVAV